MKQLKVAAFWLAQLIFYIAIIESVFYFYLKTSANPHHRARRVLQQHSTWGWQSQANLNTTFEGRPLVTDSNGFRIEDVSKTINFQHLELLTLGPSSAFGWGVDADKTYTALVGKNINVSYLNASQIGFSTEQGRILWEKFLQNRLPNLKYVLISYGINDLDRFRFYDHSFVNDLDYFSKSSAPGEIGQSKFNSNITTAFHLFKDEVALKLDCSSIVEMKQRLTIDESEQVLLKLITNLKKKNVKVFVLSSPYIEMQIRQEYRRADLEMYYKSAQLAAGRGECAEALDFLRAAKKLEPWRVQHDVVLQTERLRKISNEQGVVFIDAYSILNKLSPQKDYFVDPVHPSNEGHKKIADYILEKIKS